MTLEASRSQRRGQIYVALAAVAWSTAGVLQRQLTLDTPTQVFGRAAFAGAALLLTSRSWTAAGWWTRSGPSGSPASAWRCASRRRRSGFIAALNYTSVARVLFILAVAPMLAALLARVTLGEPISRRDRRGDGGGAGGVAVMLGAPGEGSLAGDGFAFLAALAFAVMVVITRWRHDVSMAPATCLSQAMLVVIFLPFADPGEIAGETSAGWRRSASARSGSASRCSPSARGSSRPRRWG